MANFIQKSKRPVKITEDHRESCENYKNELINYMIGEGSNQFTAAKIMHEIRKTHHFLKLNFTFK